MEVYCLFMMRKKAKAITMTVTLILAIILICIKVTHFVIIERPLKQCRIVSAYHLTVDTNGAQIDQSWLFEKDDLTYIDIAKTFEQTYFVTDYAGGSGDSGALNELTIAFGETMDGMPDIRITVSENGYIQINGKRAYPLSLKYAGKRLYVHLLGCLQDGANQQQEVTYFENCYHQTVKEYKLNGSLIRSKTDYYQAIGG